MYDSGMTHGADDTTRTPAPVLTYPGFPHPTPVPRWSGLRLTLPSIPPPIRPYHGPRGDGGIEGREESTLSGPVSRSDLSVSPLDLFVHTPETPVRRTQTYPETVDTS